MPTTGYPEILPNNTKVINTAYPVSLNPNFDITWSFEFNLSGTSLSSQGGLVSFLTTSDYNYVLTGGNVGIDLGYSGLSGLSSYSTYISGGVLSAVLGIGFDTTGLFALSTSINSNNIRSGVGIENIIPNSITIRGGYPSYTLLSTVSCPFSILNNTGEYVSVRCRLGNIGQTLYVDYKRRTDLNYTNLVTLPVTLPINVSTVYTPGISFASPVSSADSNNTATLKIKNFHIEGREDRPQSTDTFDEVIDKDLFTLLTEASTNCVSGIVANFNFSTDINDLSSSALAIQDLWSSKVVMYYWPDNGVSSSVYALSTYIESILSNYFNFPASVTPINPLLEVVALSTGSTLIDVISSLQDSFNNTTTIDAFTGVQGLTAIQSSYPEIGDISNTFPFITSIGGITFNTSINNFGITPVWFEEREKVDYFFLNL